MRYTLICGGPSPYTTRARWRAWIAELEQFPADDLGAQAALRHARHVLEWMESNPQQARLEAMIAAGEVEDR